MNSQRSLLAVAIALGLAACGSDSSGSEAGNTDGGQSATYSLSAKAADGYLVGANACLDINNNKVCDDGEPAAVTGGGGEFSLDALTQTQLEQGVVLIEVVAGQTIDTDNPDVVLSQSYTLSAPPGATFVSPLTTLVQHEIENGRSLEQATASVQETLGLSLDLGRDYIAAKASAELTAEQQADYETLHRVAQVTASIMADNHEGLAQVAAGEGISAKALASLINEEVSRVLTTVVNEIATAGDQFAAHTIASGINRDHIGLDRSNLVEKIKAHQADKQAVSADLAKLLSSGGLYWLDGETADHEARSVQYGQLSLSRDGEVEDAKQVFDYARGQFVPAEPKGDRGQMVLTDQGWSAEDDTVVQVRVLDDNALELVKGSSVLNEIITAKQLNVGGVNVRTLLQREGGNGVWADVLPTTLTFPDNMKAYQLTSSNASHGFYSFNKGRWCDDARMAELNGMCNGLSAFKDGQDTWLTTLAATASQDESNRAGTFANADLIPMGGVATGGVYAQLLSDGQVVYYSMPWDWSTPYARYDATGTWQDIRVNGVTLREVALPVSLAAQTTWSNFNSADNKAYLSVVDGFVRVTHFVQANSGGEEYVFDREGMRFLLDNYAQPMTLQACLDGLPDAGYTAQIGDRQVYAVQRSVPWQNDGAMTDFVYRFEHAGSQFSWLTDSNVTGLPAALGQAGLTQTVVTGYDAKGSHVFTEEQYQDADFFYGLNGHDPVQIERWGSVKVVLPAPTGKEQVKLGVTTSYGQFATVTLGQILDAVEETPVEQLTSRRFTYGEKYLGSERVTVAAGTFEACKVYSETVFADATDKATVWMTNRGVVKQWRQEPSWEAEIHMQATSLPAVR
ncbi:hypothetical protein [Vibrio proteolyticus]